MPSQRRTQTPLMAEWVTECFCQVIVIIGKLVFVLQD
jgi:hypothetical protein